MTTIRAAILRMLHGDRQPSNDTENLELRQAISLVLHEHSSSAVVRAAAADAQRHADKWFQPASVPPIVDYAEIPPASTWLTAALGCPEVIHNLATDHPSRPTVIPVDQIPHANATANLFRAAATLHLPIGNQDVVVIAAIVRPGGRGIAILWKGPFQWPERQADALRAIERLIQAHAGQWRPPGNIWAGGAEDVLPAGEIMDA